MSRDGIDGSRPAAGLWPADSDALRACQDVLALLAGLIVLSCFLFVNKLFTLLKKLSVIRVGCGSSEPYTHLCESWVLCIFRDVYYAVFMRK